MDVISSETSGRVAEYAAKRVDVNAQLSALRKELDEITREEIQLDEEMLKFDEIWRHDKIQEDAALVKIGRELSQSKELDEEIARLQAKINEMKGATEDVEGVELRQLQKYEKVLEDFATKLGLTSADEVIAHMNIMEKTIKHSEAFLSTEKGRLESRGETVREMLAEDGKSLRENPEKERLKEEIDETLTTYNAVKERRIQLAEETDMKFALQEKLERTAAGAFST